MTDPKKSLKGDFRDGFFSSTTWYGERPESIVLQIFGMELSTNYRGSDHLAPDKDDFAEDGLRGELGLSQLGKRGDGHVAADEDSLRLGALLELRGAVDDDTVEVPYRCAVFDGDISRVHPAAEPEGRHQCVTDRRVELRQTLLQRPRRADGGGIVGEEAHHAVARRALDLPSVGGDDLLDPAPQLTEGVFDGEVGSAVLHLG